MVSFNKIAYTGAFAAVALAEATSTAVVTAQSTDVETATTVQTVTSCSGGCTKSESEAPATTASSVAPASSSPCEDTSAPAATTEAPQTSVVYEQSTVVEAETSMVTITHCTGSDVVSCHKVTTQPPATSAPVATTPCEESSAPAPSTPCEESSAPVPATSAPATSAPAVTTAPIQNGTTPAGPSSSADLTTYVTVSAGETVTRVAPCPTCAPATSNGTLPQPSATTGAEQVNGAASIKAGVAGFAVAVGAALLL